MREYLNRFSLDALKLNATTNPCASILWIVVVACAWFSVNRERVYREVAGRVGRHVRAW